MPNEIRVYYDSDGFRCLMINGEPMIYELNTIEIEDLSKGRARLSVTFMCDTGEFDTKGIEQNLILGKPEDV